MTERSAGNRATPIVRLVPVLPVIALIAVACAASARLGLALNPVLGFMGFTAFFMLAIDRRPPGHRRFGGHHHGRIGDLPPSTRSPGNAVRGGRIGKFRRSWWDPKRAI